MKENSYSPWKATDDFKTNVKDMEQYDKVLKNWLIKLRQDHNLASKNMYSPVGLDWNSKGKRGYPCYSN